MKEQQRVTLCGKELCKANNKLDQLLAEGWMVVDMCSFSESISLNYGGGHPSNGSVGFVGHSIRGEYGVVFIVEREKPMKK